MKEGNGNGSWQEHIERHDRLITSILEHQDAFRTDLGHLLRAQVLVTEAHEKLTEAQRRTDEKMAETAEKLNALISIVDGFVRRPPQA
ncbi:MAG: hypothetical protein JJE04_10665 [Acidobacteriia bacterium]|nr:hypothetical protein [Terriglobia bacterium]